MKQPIPATFACLFLAFTASGAEVDYHADVAPILRDYCAGCHNESDYDGEFSVETFRALMEGGESGKTAVVPGKVDRSFLAATILRKSRPAMPPKKEPQPSPEQVEILLRWIREGAKGPAPENDGSLIASLNVPEIEPAGTSPEPVTAMDVHGELRAVASYGKVRVFREGQPEPVRVLEFEGKVNAIHFSPDGKRMIAASGTTGIRGIASVREIATGEELLVVGEGAHRDILFDAEFSPDGRLIATAGYDRSIRLWEAASGKFLRKIEGHNGAIFDLAFSPDGSLIASASADETGKVWRVSDGERLDTLNQPEGELFRIAFTPDGKFVVGAGGDRKIRLWRLLSRDRPRINPVIHARFAHEEPIAEMEMSPDGRWLATSSADGTVKIWTLPGLGQAKLFGGQPDLVSVLVFGQGGELIAGRMNGSVDRYPIAGLTAAGKRDGEKEVGAVATATDAPASAELRDYEEREGEVVVIRVPAKISGKIGERGDRDDFRVSMKKGETWVLETNAARSKSPLDSKIEVLTEEGEPIVRVQLQAVRESWFTFRGKDSNTSDDFRVHNWREMELNEFLYAAGEVVKLWHYPRGPDSGFKVYPGFGNRVTYFGTTPLSHPLGGPCYIVEPLAPEVTPRPNGLPVFPVYWENDDDGERKLGSDSRLTFVAPRDDGYRVRVSDVRGFGGEDFSYQLTIRRPRPDFSVSHNGGSLQVSPGSGGEIEFKAARMDGFDGEIEVRLENLPPGFSSYPVTIEANQLRAYAAIRAEETADKPTPEQIGAIRMVARAKVGGRDVEKTGGGFSKFGLGAPSKLLVGVIPEEGNGKTGKDGILELEVAPGETISALVEAERIGYEGRITFGKDDSGRNLPHGVYVDNIGLNGLMIPEKQTRQRFWITAANWVPETERIFHLRTAEAGKQATLPVRIRVVR